MKTCERKTREMKSGFIHSCAPILTQLRAKVESAATEGFQILTCTY